MIEMVQSRRRQARRASFCAAILVVATVGCGPAYKYGFWRPNGLIDFGVRNDLRTANEFAPSEIVTQPARQLTDVPMEPEVAIVAHAKKVANPGAEEESVALSLPEVRLNALQHNLNLQVELYNPLLREQGYVAELWKFESILSATQTHDVAVDGAGNEADAARFDTAVRVPNRLGGAMTLGLPITRTIHDVGSFNPRTQMFGGRTDSEALQFGVSQPILRNAGAFVNHASIDLAGLLMVQTDAATRLAAIRVLANVEQAYWVHYAAHSNLQNQLQLYDFALEQVRMSKRLVEEGVRTQTEVTRAESGLAQRFEQVVSAELARRIAERNLKRTMNNPDWPVEGHTILVPATVADPRSFVFDRPQVLELAFGSRMELFQNQIQQEMDRITIGVTRNSILPDVRFDFRYAFSGDGDNMSKAFERVWRPDSDTYSVSLTSEIPLQGNQNARARTRQSMLALSQTMAFRRAIAIGIAEEVENAMDSVEQTWHRVVANRLSVATAQKTYEAERIAFEQGESTNTDVFLQLSNFAQAQQLLVQSNSDFQRALVDLAFATGTVLGQGGVIWGQPNELDGAGNGNYDVPFRDYGGPFFPYALPPMPADGSAMPVEELPPSEGIPPGEVDQQPAPPPPAPLPPAPLPPAPLPPAPLPPAPAVNIDP